MEQPFGYMILTIRITYVDLRKPCTGKQTPRAWFQHLSCFLRSLDFQCTRVDTSLLFFQKEDITLYLLVYIEDIILTGNSPMFIQNFIIRLNKEFAIKDLGLTLNMIETFLLVLNFLASAQILTSRETPFEDPTRYLSLVSALQYLTISRPDLSLICCQSRKSISPSTHH
ncbi:hypothetical protein OSB04_016145 [Centaurea solstitialis]|uniref:Reverse transcriptase Ty1/copia-type domain-containing protein n=1 Tax=Centaurea solstitialis TaxID=347529 RepID=A0AA38TC97_9ASTR|nr:hypothetical protein OSB04_016145 [Centaurea solstitialis]